LYFGEKLATSARFQEPKLVSITLEKKFSIYKDRVNQYLETILPPISANAPQNLYAPIRYAMEGNGKRLRPVLLMLVCEALHGTIEEALPAAAAVELMHNYTLVHDDIMDRDTMRRGRPTVHCKWDTDIALLAGDGLMTLAYRSLLRTNSTRLQRICQVLTECLVQLCEGQTYDHDYEQRDDVTMAQYLNMIRKKTACFFSLCTELGALIAQAPDHEVSLFRQFGENLGLAFQIQDDLFDISVAQEILGKDFGSDVKRRKRTFLYVYAMTHGSPRHRKHLQQIFHKTEIAAADVLAAQETFRDTGALAAAEAALGEYLQEARRCLAHLDSLSAAADLHAFVEMILKRKA
jgi:geranylgeranyl diphosphate synthase type II